MGFNSAILRSSIEPDVTDDREYMLDDQGRLRAVPNRITQVSWHTDEWYARWWMANAMRKNWLLASHYGDVLSFQQQRTRPRYTPSSEYDNYVSPTLEEMGMWAEDLYRAIHERFSENVIRWHRRGLIGEAKARRMLRCKPACVDTARLQRSCELFTICPHCAYRRHLLLIRRLVRILRAVYKRREAAKPMVVQATYAEDIDGTDNLTERVRDRLRELTNRRRIVRQLCSATEIDTGLAFTNIVPLVRMSDEYSRERDKMRRFAADPANAGRIAEKRASARARGASSALRLVPRRTFADYDHFLQIRIAVLGLSWNMDNWSKPPQTGWQLQACKANPKQHEIVNILDNAHAFPANTLAPLPDSVASAILGTQYKNVRPLGDWKDKIDLHPRSGKFPKPLPRRRSAR